MVVCVNDDNMNVCVLGVTYQVTGSHSLCRIKKSVFYHLSGEKYVLLNGKV